MRSLTLLLLVSSFLMPCLVLEAAVAIEVEYKGETYQVIGVDRSRPVIEVDGKTRTVSSSKITMRREGGTPFKEGFYRIKDRQVRLQNLSPTGRSRNKNLIFSAEIMTSTDVENCFIVLASMPRGGKTHIILRGLKDFKANEWAKVYLIEPIGQSYPGVKSTKHLIFSNGAQVFTQQQARQERRKRGRR